MKNYKYVVLLDTFFTFIISFLIILAFLRYVLLFKALPYLLSGIISLCVSLLFYCYKYKKYNAYFLKKKEKQQLDSIIAEMQLANDEYLLKWFTQFFNKMNLKTILKNNSIILNDRVICKFFYDSEFTKNELIKIIKNTKTNFNYYIFTFDYSKDCDNLLSIYSNKIKIINGQELYHLMKQYDFFYPVQIKKSDRFGKIKKILVKSCTKKRALIFALASAIFMLYSKYSFFKTYYKVCAILTLILSVTFFVLSSKKTAVNQSIDQLFKF